MPVCFLVRDRKEVDPEGRGKALRIIEGGKGIIKIHYVREKKKLFSIKGGEYNCHENLDLHKKLQEFKLAIKIIE